MFLTNQKEQIVACILLRVKFYDRTLFYKAETNDFAHLTSHPVQGWAGKNKTAASSPGTQNGRRVIKVYNWHIHL